MSEAYALQMPSNYVLMDDEEMEYLDGGGQHWWNSTWFVGGAIDAALYLVPVIAAANKATKAGKALNRALSMVGATKSAMVNGSVKLLAKAGFKVARSTVERAIGTIWAFGGWSIGGLIAWGIDQVDGYRNSGYIFD